MAIDRLEPDQSIEFPIGLIGQKRRLCESQLLLDRIVLFSLAFSAERTHGPSHRSIGPWSELQFTPHVGVFRKQRRRASRAMRTCQNHTAMIAAALLLNLSKGGSPKFSK